MSGDEVGLAGEWFGHGAPEPAAEPAEPEPGYDYQPGGYVEPGEPALVSAELIDDEEAPPVYPSRPVYLPTPAGD